MGADLAPSVLPPSASESCYPCAGEQAPCPRVFVIQETEEKGWVRKSGEPVTKLSPVSLIPLISDGFFKLVTISLLISFSGHLPHPLLPVVRAWSCGDV